MRNRISIEFICVFDLPPVKFVELTASLGCSLISCGLQSMGGAFNINRHPIWSLRDNESLRTDMVKAMQDNDVAIALADGFAIRPGREVSDLKKDMALVKALGVTRICSYSMEPDRQRSLDQLATLAEMAADAELTLILEFVPGLPIGDLQAAVSTLESLNSDHCLLMIDAMHLFRSGSTIDDLASLDKAIIGYAQICDVPLQNPTLNYMEESLYERRVPGEGELPLADLLAVLPRDIPVGIEVPQRSLVEQRVSDHDRLLPNVVATRELLQQIPLP